MKRTARTLCPGNIGTSSFLQLPSVLHPLAEDKVSWARVGWQPCEMSWGTLREVSWARWVKLEVRARSILLRTVHSNLLLSKHLGVALCCPLPTPHEITHDKPVCSRAPKTGFPGSPWLTLKRKTNSAWDKGRVGEWYLLEVKAYCACETLKLA